MCCKPYLHLLVFIETCDVKRRTRAVGSHISNFLSVLNILFFVMLLEKIVKLARIILN
jgi:hypothetical protein